MMNDAPLMLSVSGARGVIGSTMTPVTAATFAAAFGCELREAGKNAAPVVVLGRDTRPSGEMLAAAAAAGLTAVGCRVIDLGVVMTPTVGVMIAELGAHGGMVITASHNPIIWNGLKALNRDGVAPPPEQAGRIIHRFRDGAIEYVEVGQLHAGATIDDASERHISRVVANVDADQIRRSRFQIALDSVNGAGCVPGRALLEQLGARLTLLNSEPTGRFAHTPEPVRENLEQLIDATGAVRADIGFAQDPDGDRLVIVDERGEFIGEEYTLVIAALYILEQAAHADEEIVVVANLSTSRMIDDVAERFGARVVRAPVGEANVVDAMKEHGAILGGEGNGGVIWPPVCLVRDSLTAMAFALGLMARRRMPLSEILREIPKYSIQKRKVEIRPGLAERAVTALAKKYHDERLDQQDGLRVDFEGRGAWLHVRPSNTEPILRVIAEARTAPEVEALIRDATAIVRDSAVKEER